MNDKAIRQPGPEHPIGIDRSSTRLLVRVSGRAIADTRKALVLREAKYPPVLYVPRSDADMAALERSELTTYCPYKGECSYYNIPLGGVKSKKRSVDVRSTVSGSGGNQRIPCLLPGSRRFDQ
jgi:uncharacterized protein (DUF427 family)